MKNWIGMILSWMILITLPITQSYLWTLCPEWLSEPSFDISIFVFGTGIVLVCCTCIANIVCTFLGDI